VIDSYTEWVERSPAIIIVHTLGPLEYHAQPVAERHTEDFDCHFEQVVGNANTGDQIPRPDARESEWLKD
jgi:hypothetical protein